MIADDDFDFDFAAFLKRHIDFAASGAGAISLRA